MLGQFDEDELGVVTPRVDDEVEEILEKFRVVEGRGIAVASGEAPVAGHKPTVLLQDRDSHPSHFLPRRRPSPRSTFSAICRKDRLAPLRTHCLRPA